MLVCLLCIFYVFGCEGEGGFGWYMLDICGVVYGYLVVIVVGGD